MQTTTDRRPPAGRPGMRSGWVALRQAGSHPSMCLDWLGGSAPDPLIPTWMAFAGAKTGYRLSVYSSSFRVPATPDGMGFVRLPTTDIWPAPAPLPGASCVTRPSGGWELRSRLDFKSLYQKRTGVGSPRRSPTAFAPVRFRYSTRTSDQRPGQRTNSCPLSE
jgi:hypothetical protein